MYLTRNIPLDSKMAAADKNVVALLNGIARRDYFGESEITNEFLHQELFADLEEEQFQSMLKKYETLMRNIVSADMDFNQLEAFLTSQMKRKQGALTQGQAAAFLKFWKSQKTKIHDVLVQKSSWNNKLKDINWRIDLKSQARHLQQINTPVAIVEMQVEKRTTENKVRCPCWFYWREVGATPRRGERCYSLYASVNSSCTQLPPPHPQATVGHLPTLSVPGVGHLKILHCPGAGHLPTAGPFPNFWHVHSFLSEYNYTEGFTGKKSRLAHLSRKGIIEGGCKGMFSILCMHFFIAYQTRIYT